MNRDERYRVNKPIGERIDFYPATQGIYIDLYPAEPQPDGRTAGSEGLGCEFFTRVNGTLRALYLELLPFDVVAIAPMELLEPVKNFIKANATPATITLETFPTHPLNPDAVWLFSPFGTALFSFDGIVIEPLEEFRRQCEQIELAAVGDRVIIGFHRDSKTLQLVMVEYFDKNQSIFDTPVSRLLEYHDKTFIDNLNALHSSFFENIENPLFRAEAAQLMTRIENIGDRQITTAIRELIDSYQKQREYFLRDNDPGGD